MTTTTSDPVLGGDHDYHVKTYHRVFVALAIFTAIEFFYAQIFANAFVVLVLGLITWAGIKAALVGLYFMHLKYEGKWVMAMLVPAGILACVFVCGLIPDVALKPETEINQPDEDGPSPYAPSPTRAAEPAAAHGASH